jgi:hypothetical protein
MTAVSANTLHAMPIPRLGREYRLTEARANIVTASAADLMAGIYEYVKRGTTRLLKLVPNSGATFDCSAAGVQKQDLADQVEINPFSQYFVGIIYTTTAPKAASRESASGFPVAMLSWGSNTTLPVEVDVADSSSAYPTEWPIVVYVSEDVEGFL